ARVLRDPHSFPTRRSSDLVTQIITAISKLRTLANEDSDLCEAFMEKRWLSDDGKRKIKAVYLSLLDKDKDMNDLKECLKQLSWRSEEHTSELQSRENLVCR